MRRILLVIIAGLILGVASVAFTQEPSSLFNERAQIGEVQVLTYTNLYAIEANAHVNATMPSGTKWFRIRCIEADGGDPLYGFAFGTNGTVSANRTDGTGLIVNPDPSLLWVAGGNTALTIAVGSTNASCSVECWE